jgi:hypothetical protein
MGETNELDRARRHFLKAAVYTAPAILAVITVNKARAQPSCTPTAQGCQPAVCPPNTGCSPDTCMPVG